MRISILPVFISLISVSVQAQSFFYVAKDLTAENLFTANIEGPNMDKAGNLFVVNYKKDGTIGIVYPDGRVELYVTLPEGSIANSIMFDRDENLLLADWSRHNVLKVDRKTKAVTVYCHSDEFNQPNDLTITKKGRLYVSDPNWKDGNGKLWRVETDGKLVLLKSELGTTNGIELSPDEKILYVNESIQRKIWAFTIDSENNLSDKRLFFEFPDYGLDGMKCDNQGNLYVARHGKGTIAILSPAGKLIREVNLKGKKASNITFGGSDGKTCFVTLQDRGNIETFRSEIAGRTK